MSGLAALVFAATFALAGCGGSGDIGGDDGDGGGGDGGNRNDGGDDIDQPDAAVCPSLEARPMRVVPTVLLLVDQSGSMNQAFSGTTRWGAMRTTLMDMASGVVKPLEHDVRFGLGMYTSRDGDQNPPCPRVTQVAPAIDNYAAIDAVFAPATPIEDTPTGESITQVVPSLLAVTEPGPKIIVLATDGEPDSCALPDPSTTAESDMTKAVAVQAARDAYTAGVQTFVIFVGTDAVSEQHLQDLANAGVGYPVGGAMNAPFYRALDSMQLVAAFDTIIGGVRTCTFDLDGTISNPSAAGMGTVTLDGMALVFGTDWQLVDPDTIEVLGAACQTLLGGGAHDLRASFPCDVYIP